jgi:peptidoglycan/LPS O-acetylase OafA/YrhL
MLGILVFGIKEILPIKINYTFLLWMVVIVCTYFHFPGFKILILATIAYSVLVFSFHPKLQLGHFSKYGDFSYGLYIYGFPIQQTIVLAMPQLSPLQLFLISYGIAFPIAVMSWHFIEKRALSFKEVRWLK